MSHSLVPVTNTNVCRCVFCCDPIFLLFFCFCFCFISRHASNFRPPQLPPHVKDAYERTAEATVGNQNSDKPQYYHHQHYYVDKPSTSTTIVKTRKDIVYKPRVGEILAKDSVLYKNQTPASSQQANAIRRNYWPLVDNTVTSLASKAAAGASAVKNLLKVGFFHTFDNVNAAVEHKKHKIASYLIQAAQEHQFALQQAKEQEKYKQQMKLAAANLGGSTEITQQVPLTNQAQHPLLPLAKPLSALIPLKQKLAKNVVQHLAKHFKKPIKKPLVAPPWIVYSKTKTLPTTTVSEGYIHTFDNKYMPPNFEGPRERNPYADMGVTSYKHFEDTILKELEEKEERKVEATMHTILDDTYVSHESLEGTKPGISQEWQPFNQQENGLFVSQAKPFTISSFDRPFSDVRPVCEHLDEVAVQPTLFVFPAGAESQNELQAASNDNSVSIKLSDGKLNSTNVAATNATTEKPNYPAYFIKQQQELRKLQQKLVGTYRGKNQTTQKPTSKAPNRGRGTPYGRRTTPIPTTPMQTTSATPTTSSTKTTEDPVFFYSINGTNDDGFRPMLPSQINAMKIKKPIRIKPTKSISTTSTISTTVRPRSSIQAQASHVQISVVSAPDAMGKRTKSAVSKHNNNKSAFNRKAPIKSFKSTASTATGNSTTTTKSSNQKTFRGSIKFSDSLHQPQTS